MYYLGIIYSNFFNRTSIDAAVAFANRVREEIEAGRRCPDGHVKDACGLPTVLCRFATSRGATR
jgi:hypothetical protein